MTDASENYGYSRDKQAGSLAPPEIDYRPDLRDAGRGLKIGLIGTGNISEYHLRAYQQCGWNVAAMSSRTRSKAEARRDEFFPQAEVYDHYQAMLERDDIQVIDVTPHPVDRLPIVRDCITARKHVLSQKPLVLDVDAGRDLVSAAEKANVLLAVNQNGRFAPHFAYMRQAINAGLIGEVTSIDFSLQWDHTWIAGIEAFEKIRHLLLFDFGIHWFDIASCFLPDQDAQSVWACVTPTAHQVYRPPALATAVVQYTAAQARLCFNAHTTLGEQDATTVVGTKGTLRCSGPSLNEQPAIDLHLEGGSCRVPLEGCWFEEGFRGTMGELLKAVEEGRQPLNSAASCLKPLEVCFAALHSADCDEVVRPGEIRCIQEGDAG